MSVRIDNKLLFLRHPRTGSTAVSDALIERGGIKAGENHAYIHAKESELVVSTIRNPYDVLATWFELQIVYDNMPKFLLNYAHSAFKHGDRLFYFADNSDVLLCYDTLQKDLDDLLTSLDIEPVVLKRVNVTPNKRPFIDYFNNISLDIVKTIYKKDLDCYNKLLGYNSILTNNCYYLNQGETQA